MIKLKGESIEIIQIKALFYQKNLGIKLNKNEEPNYLNSFKWTKIL